MGKKSRRGGAALAEPPGSDVTAAAGEVPVVGGREPCPCGSGKRYKGCHGRTARDESSRLVQRPFKGLTGEADWVALREIVPAATARVRLTADAVDQGPGTLDLVPEAHRGREVTVVTVLPMAWPALHRADGQVFVGLQTAGASGDPSRDVADALLRALATEPGNPVLPGPLPGPGPRLQDLLDPAAEFEVTVHEGFDFWLEDSAELTPEVRDSLERANGMAVPTARVAGVGSAYWCRMGERRHLRWVMTEPEETVLTAIARLHAAGSSAVAEGARFVGSFRAHGLVVPVWDLAPDTEAADLEGPAAEFAARLATAMADDAPLTPDERRARAGVVSRQVTLR